MNVCTFTSGLFLFFWSNTSDCAIFRRKRIMDISDLPDVFFGVGIMDNRTLVLSLQYINGNEYITN